MVCNLITLPDCGENKKRRIARSTRRSYVNAVDAYDKAERAVNEYADRRMKEFEEEGCPTNKGCSKFRKGHKTKSIHSASIYYDWDNRRYVATVRALYEVVYFCDKNPPPPTEDEDIEEEVVEEDIPETPPVITPPAVTTPPPTPTATVPPPIPAIGAGWCTGTVNYVQGVTPGIAVGTSVCFPCPGAGGCLDRAELHYTRYPLSGVGIIIVTVNRGACGVCPIGSLKLNPPELLEFGWRLQHHS